MTNIIILNPDIASEHFELIKYPDGQKNVRLNLDKLDIKKPVTIKCRVRNFSELEILIALIGALKRNDFYIGQIDYIYLFGMRSDRMFNTGESSYFKDVLLPILGSFKERNTQILFPHNDMILNLMDAVHYKISIRIPHEFPIYQLKNILFGDQSAHYLRHSFTENFGRGSDSSFEFKKARIENSFVINLLQQEIDFLIKSKKTILISDDLCDAGGTFIAEAKYLRKQGVQQPLNLFVGHGLFIKGLDPLLEHFDHIYCTNSYSDIEHPRVTQIKVI